MRCPICGWNSDLGFGGCTPAHSPEEKARRLGRIGALVIQSGFTEAEDGPVIRALNLLLDYREALLMKDATETLDQLKELIRNNETKE